MSDPVQELKALQPKLEFFIGIDSDGCAYDSMEIKHKECFCPQFIKYFDLQSVSRIAREAWEYVNLYSVTRGCNRFKALLRSMELLDERPEVHDRNCKIDRLPALTQWVEEESKLGNPALEAKVGQSKNKELTHILEWSLAVNTAISDIVHGVPPFPLVKECLELAVGKADLLVISQTPIEALSREWKENGIDGYLRFIAGQEVGTKSEHLQLGAEQKYAPEKILMIGDAPGDLQAAEAVGGLFYPIIPGNEEFCWKRLLNEGLPKFFEGSYQGKYEADLRKEFSVALPDSPPWKNKKQR